MKEHGEILCVQVTKEHARKAGAYADTLNCLLSVAFSDKLGKRVIAGGSDVDGYTLTDETLDKVEEAYFPKRWWHHIPFVKIKNDPSALPRKDFTPFIAIATKEYREVKRTSGSA